MKLKENTIMKLKKCKKINKLCTGLDSYEPFFLKLVDKHDGNEQNIGRFREW